MNSLQSVLQQLLQFRDQRNWRQFHSPRNVAESIVLEAAELLEVFQWKQDDKLSNLEKRAVADEMADIFNWLLVLAHDLEIDLIEAATAKIKKNAQKYPIDKAKNNSKKYTQL